MKALRSGRRMTPMKFDVGKRVQDTRSELRKISWPSREETIRLTIVVIALSISLALFLGVIIDGLFLELYQRLLRLK